MSEAKHITSYYRYRTEKGSLILQAIQFSAETYTCKNHILSYDFISYLKRTVNKVAHPERRLFSISDSLSKDFLNTNLHLVDMTFNEGDVREQKLFKVPEKI